MRSLILALWAGSALGLALTGCAPPPRHHRDDAEPKAVTALDCPARQGDLSLTSKAANATSCAYAGPDGSQVNLSLVPVANGEADVALKPIVASLTAQIPPLPPQTAASRDQNADWNDAGNSGGSDVNLPGMHVHKGAGGEADVDIAGIHIRAHGDGGDDSNGQANVQIDDGHGHEQVVVQAHDGGAQVVVSGGGPGVRRVFILASKTPGPNGYRFAGYVARGPDSGPLVVAQMLARTKEADDLRGDARALVRLNTGT